MNVETKNAVIMMRLDRMPLGVCARCLKPIVESNPIYLGICSLKSNRVGDGIATRLCPPCIAEYVGWMGTNVGWEPNDENREALDRIKAMVADDT